VNNRFSEIFVRRPVATTLLTVGVIFAGLLGYSQLPVSPLPQVDGVTDDVGGALLAYSDSPPAPTAAPTVSAFRRFRFLPGRWLARASHSTNLAEARGAACRFRRGAQSAPDPIKPA
jgi:hypothetical protein